MEALENLLDGIALWLIGLGPDFWIGFGDALLAGWLLSLLYLFLKRERQT